MNYIEIPYDKLPFCCGDIVQIVKGENAGLTGVVEKFNGFGCYLKVLSGTYRWHSYNEIRAMNKNINLCEILKGHEGETFYSSIFGDVKLTMVKDDVEDCESPIFTESDYSNEVIPFSSKGEFFMQEEALGCTLFPSKDQRDWNKWDKENNPKVPKTWSELIKNNMLLEYKISVVNNQGQHVFVNTSPIEKSALALLKIHKLIEVGYGGNVTYERCSSIRYENVFKVAPCGSLKNGLTFDIIEVEGEHDMNHVMFHTKEQAEEFLSYSENVQLLKDYFMI